MKKSSAARKNPSEQVKKPEAKPEQFRVEFEDGEEALMGLKEVNAMLTGSKEKRQYKVFNWKGERVFSKVYRG